MAAAVIILKDGDCAVVGRFCGRLPLLGVERIKTIPIASDEQVVYVPRHVMDKFVRDWLTLCVRKTGKVDA